MKEKILLTGGSGFLGNHILNRLNQKNFDVITLGRNLVNQSQEHIYANFADENEIDFGEIHSDFVIHCAGKAHIVPKTEIEKEEFYKVNRDGTKKLLKALEISKPLPKVFILISTVAVYGLDKGINISENSELNPESPYAQSKRESEVLVESWCKNHSVRFLVFRLPLVVGNFAPGNLSSLQKAIRKGIYIKIADNNALKSMVLANDVADLILNSFNKGEGYYNLTDGIDTSISDLENAMERRFNRRTYLTIPKFLLAGLAKIGDFINFMGISVPLNSNKYEKITNSLTFDTSKAKNELEWDPSPVLTFVENNIEF